MKKPRSIQNLSNTVMPSLFIHSIKKLNKVNIYLRYKIMELIDRFNNQLALT